MSDTASGTDPDPQAGRQKRAIPDLFLLQYLPIIPRGVALDLGAGNGRNSIFLAEHGFEVDAFDRGTESVAELMTAARERNLPIRAIRNEVTTLTILPKRYSLAVIAWVLMFLRRGERDGVVKMAIRGLLPGGFIYLGVFSTHDPGYALCKEKFELEKRRFLPHLTLGRQLKTRAKIKEEERMSLKFDEIVLYRSILSRSGSRYKKIISFKD